MEIKCSHEADFARLDMVFKEVMGNGKEGLAKSSIRLQESVNNLIETIQILQTGISGFTRFQIETESQIRENQRHKTNRKWYISTIITLGSFIVAAVGLYIISK